MLYMCIFHESFHKDEKYCRFEIDLLIYHPTASNLADDNGTKTIGGKKTMDNDTEILPNNPHCIRGRAIGGEGWLSSGGNKETWDRKQSLF